MAGNVEQLEAALQGIARMAGGTPVFSWAQAGQGDTADAVLLAAGGRGLVLAVFDTTGSGAVITLPATRVLELQRALAEHLADGTAG